MKILVTGVSGFIGCRLAQLLRDWGHTPVATGRVESPVEADRVARLNAAGIAVETGSLLDAGFAAKLVVGCDAVIHLAAESHVDRSINGSRVFIETNVVGTFNLLEAARRHWASLPPEAKWP